MAKELFSLGIENKYSRHADDFEVLPGCRVLVCIDSKKDESFERPLNAWVRDDLLLESLARTTPLGVEIQKDEFSRFASSNDRGCDGLRDGGAGSCSESRGKPLPFVDLWLEAQIGNRPDDFGGSDLGGVVLYGEGVSTEVDLDSFDSCEPFQGRFDPVGSGESRSAAAALHHAADENRDLRELAIDLFAGRALWACRECARRHDRQQGKEDQLYGD